ncbi:MAG: hypothetical protein HYZ75_10820 [Elusimicrobia bacterium]|nr:hypothetical protein [Elusimicrobiota bacterium]
MRFLAAVLAAAAPLLAADARAASILGSKHNLSADSATSGPRAASQKGACVFCHSVHQTSVFRALWGRKDSEQTFTFYSSNYLNSYLGMRVPTMEDLKVSRTKLCLSCHDGVTALGSLYNMSQPLAMDPARSMAAASVLGADLRNDHPVLYDVKPGAGPPSAPGTDPEIQLPPPGDKVKVYGASNRVECTSCHNPHDDQYGKFLVKSNAGAALCTTCHNKAGWSASAHAVSNKAYTPTGGAPTTVAEYSCRACHQVHGANAAQAYLLRGAEEQTCYGCHGTPPLTGAKDIRSLLASAYTHPVETKAGVHKNPEADASNLGNTARHAECWDCHNPHQAQTGTAAPASNLIGGVLRGGWGVEPLYGSAAWTAPSQASYARQSFSNTASFKQYQLCFKCHSSYAFGTTPPAGTTDSALEYNPNNRSAHPALAGLNSRSGGLPPQALGAAQVSARYAGGVGSQTLSCTECHGADSAASPKGPHGSSVPRLLTGARRYWPTNASGVLWSLNDLKDGANGWQSDLFCANCHPLYDAGRSPKWFNNVHEKHEGRNPGDERMHCVACHVRLPHGSKRGRLIGYDSDLPPYNNNGGTPYSRLVLKGFKKAAGPTSYAESNCYSEATGCHNHTNAGGYDP